MRSYANRVTSRLAESTGPCHSGAPRSGEPGIHNHRLGVGGDGASSDPAETILLTIFLKHDQSKNLEGIQGHLASTGWWERFPPKGVEIVSWNVVMGIGQIVTLRLPPHLINVVNVEIERCAWGAFSTEFFPTYDFIPVRERLAREWREARAKQTGAKA